MGSAKWPLNGEVDTGRPSSALLSMPSPLASNAAKFWAICSAHMGETDAFRGGGGEAKMVSEAVGGGGAASAGGAARRPPPRAAAPTVRRSTPRPNICMTAGGHVYP